MPFNAKRRSAPAYKQRRLARAAALRNRIMVHVNGECDPKTVQLICGALAQFAAQPINRQPPPEEE